MSTSHAKNSMYILCTIMMEMEYHVPTKSYIYNTKLDPFTDNDRNYTSKPITKKHFTFEWPLQKTKYRNSSIEPNKFGPQIKLMNLEIQRKKYTRHELLNTNKRIYHNALDKY